MKNTVCINACLLPVSCLSVYVSVCLSMYVSVCLSLSFPSARKASSRAPNCPIPRRQPPPPPPQILPSLPTPPTSPADFQGQTTHGSKAHGRGGEAGVASSLRGVASRDVNPKENRVYSQVSLGKAGVSQPPPKSPGAAPAAL